MMRLSRHQAGGHAPSFGARAPLQTLLRDGSIQPDDEVVVFNTRCSDVEAMAVDLPLVEPPLDYRAI